MSLMPWKPPVNLPPSPPAPTGVGLIGWLGHAFKLLRFNLVGFILTFIGFALVPLIIKVLGALGVGFVTYQLGQFALGEIFSLVQSNINQLPPEVLAFVGIAKIGEAISIVFGGLAARLALMGFSGTGSTAKKRGMIWEA